MLLMIDNYDSFTYNVVQYLGELGAEVKVVRNDELSVEQIRGWGWTQFIHPDDLQSVQTEKKRALEQQKQFSGEYRLRRPLSCLY